MCFVMPFVYLYNKSDYSTDFASLNCRIFCQQFASLIWQNFLLAIRFAHLAKEVTFKGQFCIFRFAQHLQNHLKCSLCSLFTNEFVYARNACAQIRPFPWFFRLPNFVLLRAFMTGWMPLYLLPISSYRGKLYLHDVTINPRRLNLYHLSIN